MIVTLNGSNVSISSCCSLSLCLERAGVPKQGIAVAVNNTIISSSQWKTHQLNENDRIAVFQAIAGG